VSVPTKHHEHFPVTLRPTRVDTLLLKQISFELATGAKMLLIKLVSGGAEAGENHSGWMRGDRDYGDHARVRLPLIILSLY
jgi:hypothetical protein